ncbi:hypothetical protein [Streptosporangium sp. NPDC051022]|uniref:hypothetical protein n=1 Tax=Streptosporangium sp. NPDC051022 TaxID=3155752 RepID=UPI003412D059
MTDSHHEHEDILGKQLVLGTGFTEEDRHEILERLTPVGKRLRSYPGDSVELRLSIKNRGEETQRLTLECVLPGVEPLVANSERPDLSSALTEVREDMIHELERVKTRRDPRHDRPHRP